MTQDLLPRHFVQKKISFWKPRKETVWIYQTRSLYDWVMWSLNIERYRCVILIKAHSHQCAASCRQKARSGDRNRVRNPLGVPPPRDQSGRRVILTIKRLRIARIVFSWAPVSLAGISHSARSLRFASALTFRRVRFLNWPRRCFRAMLLFFFNFFLSSTGWWSII